jgi:hypothetical protein
VLGDLGDDVVAALAIHFGHALDGQIVAFGGARGEDDLLRGGADYIRNLLARGFHGLLGFPSERVIAAGRIAEFLGKVWQHGFQDPRIERSSSVIIHIDRQLDPCRHFYLALKCAHSTPHPHYGSLRMARRQ